MDDIFQDSDLRRFAVFPNDDPREGVGEAGGVGANQRPSLVHVRSHLEILKTYIFLCCVNYFLQRDS